VVEALAPSPGDVIVDATFGAGGYTRRLLAAGATVHAFDRDPDAIAAGRRWPEAQGDAPRLVLHPRRFSELAEGLAEAGVTAVQGVVFDIGVSSMQLDQAARGFAFSSDGPLDMRMSQDGPSAADFLNEADEQAIADVLYRYGEERQSRRVARAIVAARPLETTGQLAAVVRKALGHRPGAPKDPATRSFQAIRIHVNGELDELVAGLAGRNGCSRRAGGSPWSASTARGPHRQAVPARSGWRHARRIAPSAAACQHREAGFRKAFVRHPSHLRRRGAQSARPLRHLALGGSHRRPRARHIREPRRMIVTANRLRSIGWVVLLALCGAVVLALSFRVNALRSQVHRAEQRIVALKQEKMYLETEFETRANQQQLKSWNDIEFGYVAPTAGQYLENERQLASLSKPADPDAPAPIRVASADDSVIASAAFPAMVSPLTGKSAQAEEAIAQTDAPAAHVDHATATAALGERLGTVGVALPKAQRPPRRRRRPRPPTANL
jgi:hypothetical protein